MARAAHMVCQQSSGEEIAQEAEQCDCCGAPTEAVHPDGLCDACYRIETHCHTCDAEIAQGETYCSAHQDDDEADSPTLSRAAYVAASAERR